MNLLPKWLRANAPAHPSQLTLTAAVQIEAAAPAADGKPAPLPRFKLTAYTGELMRLEGWNQPVIIDLAGIQLGGKVKALRDHNPGRIVGHAERAEVNAAGVQVEGVISGTGADAREVTDSGKNGFPWEASVGANPSRVEFLHAGKTALVNNRTVTGPAYIARAATLREVSFVALGADPNTSASVAASAKPENTPMPTFAEWLKAKNIDQAALTEPLRLALQAAYDAERATGAGPAPSPTSPAQPTAPQGAAAPAPTTVQAQAPTASSLATDAVAQLRAQMAAETERVAKIDALTAGQPAIKAKAIGEGWTVEKTELEVLRASRPQAPAAILTRSGTDSDRINAQAIEAAMCLSVGMRQEFVANQVPTSAREQVMNAAVASPMRGVGLQFLMDRVIAASGRHFSGDRRTNDFIRATFEADQMLRASGFSTVSLSNILENIANKGLIAAYTGVEVTWPLICGVRSHGDFKVTKRYRLDSTGAFKKVGPDGELKHISLTDAAYSNKLETFGAIVALTRQHIIDDDLGAFMELPAMLGRQSALRKEEAVYALWLSNPGSFFATGNGNYFEGASTNLSIDALTTAEQKFLDQVDSNGKPVLVRPANLLVPTVLKNTADNLMSEKLIIDGTATAKQPARNPHAGKYKVVTSPYLNNTAIKDQDGAALTGQSSTAWYLTADPAVRAAIAIAFLQGRQQPTIESAQTDFSTLGIQWRAYDDFGVGMEETVAAVKSKGAA